MITMYKKGAKNHAYSSISSVSPSHTKNMALARLIT